MMTLELPDEAATAAFAARIADLAILGDVIALTGGLGAGKTAFARAFIRARSGDEGMPVPSPTFTLVQVYEMDQVSIWHFDFYRLHRPDEVQELGLEDALNDGISLIEWPEIARDLLPPAQTLGIALSPGANLNARRATVSGGTNWTARLAAFAVAGLQ